MFKELDNVVLKKDIPDEGLKAGDAGAVVLVHRGGEGYEVEFLNIDGETLAIVTVNAKDLRASKRQEITHVRVMVA